eukprot:3110404-Heterocapsa_arctica.AAC.1
MQAAGTALIIAKQEQEMGNYKQAIILYCPHPALPHVPGSEGPEAGPASGALAPPDDPPLVHDREAP